LQQVLDGPIGNEILNSFDPEAAIRSSRFMQEKWKDLEGAVAPAGGSRGA